MALTKQEFSNYIKHFNFREMFNDMGWNNDKTTQPIAVDNISYTLQAVAEKSGFKILLCHPQADGLIPDYATRKKIETKVTKLFQEHLVIFFDTKKTEQVWQLVVRQTGKPIKVTETRYQINQDPELLFQRASGIFFEMDEEENITIVDVTKRVSENFHQNNEKVTKHFYDKFKKEHTSFLTFITGIDDKVNKDWYASLMLNRLMFCYFIQKKGFLDNNKNYLRSKLMVCQEKKGKNKFYSFYRNFLLSLFHQGLGSPDHSKELKEDIGKIPYLNGGLFDEHELETTYIKIDIDDKAFEKIFDFFDQYEWHLDTRIAATGKDINPDVIGYIFEKYINDRANMGAYYTKEDITDYISKNCILPFIFDEAKRQNAKAFLPDAELWSMVKKSGDEYIYDAAKKGVELPLPKEVSVGIKDTTARTEWNKPASINLALPTEIWREVIDRRSRYTETKTKIEKGEIQSVNDFITYNLNIRQFAQHTVENTTDPELLKCFYKALNSVTIIDPTCGSGAFLFAAMNILEPLYESCIQRMENFVAEAPKNKYKYFEEILVQVKSPEHPNLQYFIYKSIILRNLYGVDIMNEAVEIAKLRLFLKLVATVEVDYKKPNLGLEPLPDIDFNIRAGNTLVGFATEADLKKGLLYTLDGVAAAPFIEEKCEIVANAFSRYKEIQLSYGDDFKQFKKAKEELSKRLKDLNAELNQLLHKQATAIPYNTWLQTHQPFHWFAEFYEIINSNGGFDVIIGNPPYVEYSKVRDTYKLSEYETIKTANLYSFTIERSIKLLKSKGYIGMIVPLSSVANQSMKELQKLLKRFDNFHLSNFHERPAQLFSGVLQRLSILLFQNTKSNGNFNTTNILRWQSHTRNTLFETLNYVDTKQNGFDNFIKFCNYIENSILRKFLKNNMINQYVNQSPRIKDNFISYRTAGGGYWRTFLNSEIETTSLSNKTTSFDKKYSSFVFSAVLNSNLFWWYYFINFDVFNTKDYMIFSFRLTYPNKEIEIKLINLGRKLEADLLSNIEQRTIVSKTKGSNETIVFRQQKSKPIIDAIDKVLAEHYGFTDVELDFIINYDIKYRMGKVLESEDDE